MNRGLLHLLLCLVLAFMGTPASAVCRPETRVGGSPVFSSVFASQELIKPIGTPIENEGCGYDFASGVHKYLYVADNPVNRIDPSGYMSSLDAAKYGRMLHTKLGEDFIEKMDPFGISGQSVATCLNKYGINLDTITALLPDLVDINPANKEVYEIKPLGVGVAAGYLQLEGYLQLFNHFDPVKTWKPGSTYTPPLEVTLDPITYALVSPPERGVIIYKLFSVKDFAKKRALNVAESESADIEDSVGISTLTTIIAF